MFTREWGEKKAMFYLGAMGEVKQVGHDFLWEHNTQTYSQSHGSFIFICLSSAWMFYPWTARPRLHTHYTHISVFVVTVGCQENFGYFIHSAEEKRQLPLVGTEREKWKKNQSVFTNEKTVCVCLFPNTVATYIFHYILLQVLDRLLLQSTLQSESKESDLTTSVCLRSTFRG